MVRPVFPEPGRGEGDEVITGDKVFVFVVVGKIDRIAVFVVVAVIGIAFVDDTGNVVWNGTKILEGEGVEWKRELEARGKDGAAEAEAMMMIGTAVEGTGDSVGTPRDVGTSNLELDKGVSE